MSALTGQVADRRCETAVMNVPTSVIVVGYAKVPVASAAHTNHEYFTISLRVERNTGTVTEVDSTAVTGLAPKPRSTTSGTGDDTSRSPHR